MGLYYLESINQDDIGQGLFGYSKQYKGLGVFLNSVLQMDKDGQRYNYLQGFVNDGNQLINPMKIKNEKNCLVKFRNLEGEQFFHFRVEYAHPTISVFTYNYEADTFESCFSIEHEMDFNGIFLITGNSGLYNPDQIIIDSFAIYNPHEKVSASHNQHFHEAHKRKATRDMERFRHDHITTDLLHST